MDCISEIFGRFFRTGDEISVYRMPPTGTFRANLLGLTTAFFLVLLILGIGYSTQQFDITPYEVAALILIFLVGTYLGLFFVLLTLIFIIILYLLYLFSSAFLESQFLRILLHLCECYIVGYIFGGILALLYNFLVFFYLHCFKGDLIHISFNYRRDQIVNIIKSPIPGEANTVPAARRLYDYTLDNPPQHPYTIVFIANPQVLRQMPETSSQTVGAYRLNRDNYAPDPIMDDLNLFMKSVDRALYCFERDEVLGHPKIWSRVRIITIFDAGIMALNNNLGIQGINDFGWVEGYQNTVAIGGLEVNNLLTIIDEIGGQPLDDILENTWNNYITNGDIPASIPFEDVDVFYFLSASPEYDRSTAQFSSISDADCISLDGPRFTFRVDPSITGVPWFRRNEERVSSPGKVALNVLSARQKTFIHEFAHAMSLAECSAIVDEYFDQMSVNGVDSNVPNSINRLVQNSALPIPILFARYNNTEFHSDLNHPSAEEDWLGFFPERAAKDIGCIMDYTIGRYQFNKLLVKFMQDRILIKSNR